MSSEYITEFINTYHMLPLCARIYDDYEYEPSFLTNEESLENGILYPSYDTTGMQPPTLPVKSLTEYINYYHITDHTPTEVDINPVSIYEYELVEYHYIFGDEYYMVEPPIEARIRKMKKKLVCVDYPSLPLIAASIKYQPEVTIDYPQYADDIQYLRSVYIDKNPSKEMTTGEFICKYHLIPPFAALYDVPNHNFVIDFIEDTPVEKDQVVTNVIELVNYYKKYGELPTKVDIKHVTADGLYLYKQVTGNIFPYLPKDPLVVQFIVQLLMKEYLDIPIEYPEQLPILAATFKYHDRVPTVVSEEFNDNVIQLKKEYDVY